jgi:hypothetical protein
VPTVYEWKLAILNINPSFTNDPSWYNDISVSNILKLPLAGARFFNATYNNQGTYGTYWTSSPFIDSGYNLAWFFKISDTKIVFQTGRRANSVSLRCLKD